MSRATSGRIKAALGSAALAIAAISATAHAIPPALPGDAARDAEAQLQRQQAIANLESAEAPVLVDRFFERMGEGEAFELGELFAPNATYMDPDGEWVAIADDLDDDGFPGIAQWEPITVFRLPDCWAAAATTRLQPLGSLEVVLKFYFIRDSAGALKISRIEEVRL